MSYIVVDTGPLVAFFNRADGYHDWAVTQFGRLKPPLHTCEAVLTETCYLLRSGGIDQGLVLDALKRGVLKLDFSALAELEPVSRLIRRYDNVSASLADVCLVRMSELHPDCRVVTIDSDFLIYRRDGRRTIPLIAPFAA